MNKYTHFSFFTSYNSIVEYDNKLKLDNVNILENKNRVKKNRKWFLEIFFLSLSLSVFFALLSELMLSHTSLALAFFLVFILVSISVIFDLIGVAVTACNIKPLLELDRRKEKGTTLAIKLVKNADKVSCICTDVVGDICSILCGAGGVSISLLMIKMIPQINTVILSIIINALIASITILGKAIGKSFALNNPTKIVLKVAKLLNFTTK